MSALELTSDVAHVGNVVKYWLDELVDKNPNFAGTGLPITVFGPEDDSADTAPPGIHWCPLTEEFSAPQRLGGPKAPGPLYMRTVPVSFVLFGGLPSNYSNEDGPYVPCKLTEVLMSKLVNCMHRTVSQQSYVIQSGTWFNSGRTGIGMSFELVVGVRLPLVREDNPTVKVTGATAHAEIAHE